MYNSCMSPAVAFRVNGSVPIRFSDSCCCLDGGLQLQSYGVWSSCGVSCSYFCCCKLCVHRVDLNSSLVYGLKQSSLLHWSGGRRLKFSGAGSGVYSRLCGIDKVDYGLECCGGDTGKVFSFQPVDYGGGKERWARRGKCRIEGLGIVERREWRRYVGGLSEAEDLIDLLADNVAESTVVSIEKEIVRLRRKKEGKKKNVCDECSRRKMKNVASGSSRGKLRHDELKIFDITSTGHGRQREENSATEKKSKVRNSDGSLGSLQGKSRREELTTADVVNVAHGRRQSEGAHISSEKNEKLRKEVSGCTSYYSVSSSGDIDDDDDIENNTYVEGQSSKFDKELRNQNDEESHDFVEETERRRNKQQGMRLEETVASGSYEGNIVVWDRKKSEKQLVETAADQSQSAARTTDKRFTTSEACNSSSNNSNVSHKQFQSSRDNSSFRSNRQVGRIYSDMTGSTEISKSRRRYNKESKFEEVHESDAITNSNQLVQSSVRQDNVSMSTKSSHARKEHREQELVRRSSQQHTGTIRIQEFDDTDEASYLRHDKQSTSTQEHSEQEVVRRSSQQSTGTIRIQEIDDTGEVPDSRHVKQSTSVQELKEDHSQRISTVTEAELRRHSQHNTDLSETNRSEIQKISSSKNNLILA